MAKLNAYQKQMLGNAGPVDIENFHLAETYRLAKRIILGKLPCAYGFVNGKFLKIGNLPWDLEVTKKNNPTTRPEVPEELWKMNDDKRRISNFLLQKQDEYLAAEHPFEMLLVNMKEELYDNFRAVDDGQERTIYRGGTQVKERWDVGMRTKQAMKKWRNIKLDRKYLDRVIHELVAHEIRIRI